MTSITSLAPFFEKTILISYSRGENWVFGAWMPGYSSGFVGIKTVSLVCNNNSTAIDVPDVGAPLFLAFRVYTDSEDRKLYKLIAYDQNGTKLGQQVQNGIPADQLATPILGNFFTKEVSHGKYYKICVYDGDIDLAVNKVSLLQSLLTAGDNTYTSSTYTFTAPVGLRPITLQLGATTSAVNTATAGYLELAGGTWEAERDYTNYTSFSSLGAVVAAPSYTLSYNAQGGSASPSADTGSSATLPSAGTKASSTFNGWWTSASGAGTLAGGVGATYAISATATLHARWVATSTLGAGVAALSSTAVGTQASYSYSAQTNYAKAIAVADGIVTYASPAAGYPEVSVNTIAHTAGSVTHMAVEMSPVVLTSGVPAFSLVLTAYSGAALPNNVMSGTGFSGTLVMNIPGVTGNSIVMQSREVQGSGSWSPAGTATRTTGDNFSLALSHLSEYGPVPPSGRAAGDPYVSTIAGKIYKLPAFNGALRLYQGLADGQMLTINATTRIDDDKAAMDADNGKMNSLLASPVTQDLQMTEAMSFFDRVHVQHGDAHAVFSLYDGFRVESPLPAGWALADKGTIGGYLKGMDFYAHLAGSVHELSPCAGVTIRLGIVPIRHIRSSVEVAAPNMALGSGALVHRLSRKQMAVKKLEDTKPLAAAKDAPVKRVVRESFVCDKARVTADIAFLG